MTDKIAINLDGISLGDLDMFDVAVLETADSVAVPEAGASTYIHSCSCSIMPDEHGDDTPKG